jgi:hypothetical protein
MSSFAKRTPIARAALAASIFILAASQARAGRIEGPPPVIEEKVPVAITVVTPETLAAGALWGTQGPDAIVASATDAPPLQLKRVSNPPNQAAEARPSANSDGSSAPEPTRFLLEPRWLVLAGAALVSAAALLGKKLASRGN